MKGNYIHGTENGKSGLRQPFFQPRLAVNQPGDLYEQEADAVAEQVVQAKPVAYTNSFFKPLSVTQINRKCAHCEAEEKEKLQRKEENGGDAHAGPELERYTSGLNNSGSSLSGSAKSFFESRMGYDFSDVKIHTDSAAAQSAQSINALAYTTGNNIVFNQNQYQPESTQGKKLLAHELTHVVQQSGNIATKRIQKKEGCGDDFTFTFDAIVKPLQQKDTTNYIPKVFYTKPTGNDADIAKYFGDTPLKPVTGQVLKAGQLDKFGWRRVCYSPANDAPEMIYWVHDQYLAKVVEPAKQTEPPPVKKESKPPTPAAPKIKDYANLEIEPEADKAKRYSGTCNFTMTDSTNPDPAYRSTGVSTCESSELKSTAIEVDNFINYFIDLAVKNVKFLLAISKAEVEGLKDEFTDTRSLYLHRSSGTMAALLNKQKLFNEAGMDSSHWGGDGSDRAAPFGPEDQEKLDEETAKMEKENILFGEKEFQAILAEKPTLEVFETKAQALCDEKLNSIEEVLKEIDADNHRVFKLDKLMNYTRGQMNISDNTVKHYVLEEYKRVYTGSATDDLLFFLDMAFIAIGFIPHPVAKAVSAVGGAVTGAIQAHDEYYKHLFIKNVNNTHFDKAKLLSSEDPDLIWLAVAILSLIPDGAETFNLLRKAGKEFKLTGDLVKFEKEVAGATLGKAMKKNVIDFAQAEKKAIVKEVDVIDEALKKSPDEAKKLLEAPVNKNLREKIDQVVPSPIEDAIFEVPMPGNHKAVKKVNNTWCVHSTEVCNIPVKDEIDVAFEKTFMQKPISDEYLKSPKLRKPSSTGKGEAARDEFDKIRENYKSQLHVKSGEDIHHAIELQVLDRYPGVFNSGDLNKLDNFRGIPMESVKLKVGQDEILKVKKQLHNSYIRWRWNHYYADLDKQIAAKGLKENTADYNSFVKAYLEAARDSIDHSVGQFFATYKRGDMKLP